MGEKLLLLYCAESGKKALGRMPKAGYRLPSSVRTFELSCTGRINEEMLMESLQDGFDGVLVMGCHRDNCKYLDGNLRAEKRVERIKALLADAGIEDKNVDMIFVGPDEGRRLGDKIESFFKPPEVK